MNGSIRPLKYKTFKRYQISNALQYINGHHDTKVLIEFGEQPLKAIKKLFFFPEKSYIILGSLQTFGLELVDWMIRKGARKFTFNSIKDEHNEYQKICFKKWGQIRGIEIDYSTRDCSDMFQAKELILDVQMKKPIGGR